MQEMGVRATRYELQQELAPHVLNIFTAFQKVVVADEHDGVVRHELAEEETEDYCVIPIMHKHEPLSKRNITIHSSKVIWMIIMVVNP